MNRLGLSCIIYLIKPNILGGEATLKSVNTCNLYLRGYLVFNGTFNADMLYQRPCSTLSSCFHEAYYCSYHYCSYSVKSICGLRLLNNAVKSKYTTTVKTRLHDLVFVETIQSRTWILFLARPTEHTCPDPIPSDPPIKIKLWTRPDLNHFIFCMTFQLLYRKKLLVF